MLKWLSRFSFTLIVAGALLFYRVYQAQQKPMEHGLETWQIWLMLFAGAFCVALGAQGIRARHQRFMR
jgi:hypothetical protein